MELRNIYVTGYGGMIGNRLVEMGCSRLYSDVTDPVALDVEIGNKVPEFIIHLAGMSGVDYCEHKENHENVVHVNFYGSRNVFEMAEKHNIPTVFISSDHIFSGDWVGSYHEDSDDVIKSKNFYGITKFATEGEAWAYENVKIVRTSTIFTLTKDAVLTYVDRLVNGGEVYPPLFIWRSFMHLDHFCTALLVYAEKWDTMPKVLHISGSKTISWWRFISDYAELLGIDTKKVHKRMNHLQSELVAPRPHRCGLDTRLSRKFGIPQYSYLDGLKLE